MRRLELREIIGIVTPLAAIAFFLFLSASGEERLIESPLVLGILAITTATVCAALFGVVGAVIAGLVLTAIAAFSEAPLASADAMVYVLPAIASWFGVAAVMVRRAMMRWKRRKHFEVGQEIDRLRTKVSELEGIMVTSGSADALALSAQVWNDVGLALSESAEALLLEVPAEVRQGESFQDFAAKLRRLQENILTTNSLIDHHGMTVAREVYLTDVAKEAIASVQALADGLGIEVEAKLQEDGIPCVIESEALVTAMSNVLRNALEATGRAGKVSVDVHSDYRNDRAMIEISDRGPGIPSDVIAQVFKPFFTTRRDRIGMGLTVAREVVNRAGGSIALAANEPRGMIVRLRLPLRRARVLREREPEVKVKSATANLKPEAPLEKLKTSEVSPDAELTTEV